MNHCNYIVVTRQRGDGARICAASAPNDQGNRRAATVARQVAGMCRRVRVDRRVRAIARHDDLFGVDNAFFQKDGRFFPTAANLPTPQIGALEIEVTGSNSIDAKKPTV